MYAFRGAAGPHPTKGNGQPSPPPLRRAACGIPRPAHTCKTTAAEPTILEQRRDEERARQAGASLLAPATIAAEAVEVGLALEVGVRCRRRPR